MLEWSEWVSYGNPYISTKGRKQAIWKDILFQIDNYKDSSSCDLYIRKDDKVKVVMFDSVKDADAYAETLIDELNDENCTDLRRAISIIKTISENNQSEFERKVNELIEIGYKVSSSSCSYVGEVGGNVYDCESWLAVLVKD